MNPNEVIEQMKQLTGMENRIADYLIYYICRVDERIRTIFFPGQTGKQNVDLLKPYDGELSDFLTRLIFRMAADITENDLDKVILSKEEVTKDLEKWYDRSHQTIGLAAAGVCLREYMPSLFADANKAAEELCEVLKTESVYIGLLLYDMQNPEHGLLRLLWCLVHHLDTQKGDELLQYWKGTEIGEKAREFTQHPWLTVFRTRLSVDGSDFLSLREDVRNALRREVFIKTYTSSKVVDVTMTGAPVCDHYEVSLFRKGEEVYKWMKEAEAGKKYLSGREPKLEEREYWKKAAAPSGCILETAKILTAEGTYKQITDIQPGEKIYNDKGEFSECSGEIIRNREVRALYAINDEQPFMSLDHLILTVSGYKCPDPETALELNPRLKISKLQPGDVVLKWDGKKQTPVVVEKINIMTDNPLPCADIHIADGWKSYITDSGYICYANYPEITAEGILRSRTPYSGEFSRFLQNNKTILKKSVGRHAYDYLLKMAEKENDAVTLYSHQPDYASIMAAERIGYRIFSDCPMEVQTLSLVRGFLFWGDSLKPIPLLVKDGEVYWKQEDVMGYMKLYHHGFLAKGHIIRAGKQMDFSAGVSVMYDMCFQADGKSESMEFGRFEMGYEKKEDTDRLVPVGKWYMPHYDEQGELVEGIAASSEYADPVGYAIDPGTHQLCAAVPFPRGIGKMEFPMLAESGCDEAEFAFSTLFDGMAGKGKMLLEEGECKEIGTITGKLSRQDHEKAQKRVDILTKCLLSGLCLESTLKESELSALKGAYQKTVEDLIALSVPSNMGEIHSQTFHRLLKMAVYAAYEKEDLSKDLLGISKPVVDDMAGDLTKEQAETAVKNKDFLVDQFISSYLSYSYIKEGKSEGSSEEFKKMVAPIVNIENSLEKVYYYMNGNGEKCMSAMGNYSEVTNAVYHSVYRNNVSGLDWYYQNNREEWARKLYNRLNAPEMLVGLVNTQIISPENAQLTHYYSMLDVLDSSKRIPLVETQDGEETELFSYATVLRKQIMDGAFKKVLRSVKLPDPDNKEAVETFQKIVVEFLKKYTKAIADGSFSSWDKATKEEMQKELDEMVKAYGFADIEAFTAGLTEVAADIVGVILTISDPDISTKVYQFFKNHPYCSRGLALMFYGLGIAAIGIGFSRLDEMTPLEQAEFAVAVADICLTALQDVAVVAAAGVFKKGFGGLTAAENTILKNISKSDFVLAMSKGKSVQDVLVELGITGTANVTDVSKFWLRFAKITQAAAKGFMFLTVGVSIGVNAYQIYEDIINGQNPGFIALDSLMILADGIFAVTEAVSCFAASVAAAVPIIGVAAAVAGIVLAVVSMFVKRKPPKSPIEIFVNDRLVGFVNALSNPPLEWLQKHPLPEENKISTFYSLSLDNE